MPITCLLHPLPCLLAVAAPLAPIPAARRDELRALLPMRAEALRQDLQARLGLGPADGLRETERQVDAFGETHVRFQQTHRGLPVWGSFALAHMDADGRVTDPHSSIRPMSAAAAATLTPAGAIQEVVNDLALTFQATFLANPTAELVVFPSRCTGGLAYTPGPQPGLFRMEPSLSVLAEPPAADHVQAYDVRIRCQDPVQGLVARDVVVDARTGLILRKEQGLQTLAGPAKVQGRSQFSGTVTLDGYLKADGAYELRDTTRPRVAHERQDTLLGPGQAPANLVYASIKTGSQTTLRTFTSPGPSFGDGLTFNYLAPLGPDLLLGSNGQTEAVDVAWGIQAGWDLLRNVAHRDGPDGQGGAVVAEAHAYLSFMSPYSNAAWDASTQVLYVGDGGGGYYPLASLDVVIHELGHAVTGATAALRYSGESGGLNEAASDIMAVAGTTYALAGGTGDVLPEPARADAWIIGAQVYPGTAGQPGIRSLQKPSIFGYAPEGWYDGMGILDVHTTSAVGNRFFYFLAEGSNPTDPLTSSEYLTRGMRGIGLQKAFQIWFRALTTKIADPLTDCAGMRRATEAAAADLHGEGSAEFAAVQDAWAAVNVGPPHGQTTSPVLRFEPGPWPDGVVQSSYSSSSRDLFVPTAGTIPLPKVLAEGFTAPPQLTWTAFFPVDTASSTIRISPLNFVGWNTSITAQAKGTPYRAMAMINPVVVDMDGDGESDAADAAVLGIFAMTGKLPTEPWDPSMAVQIYPPPMLIYRWNRAFQNQGGL